MRYALRNQEKIKNKLGIDFHKYLIESLTYYFKNNEIIKEYTYDNERFSIIHVENKQPKTDSFFEFYIIKKTFDSYLLAYKSCIV